MNRSILGTREIRSFGARAARRGYSTGQKLGILMMNMGGPRTQADVGPFLRNIFADRDILKLPLQD
ncbi:hypothetical protein GGF43_002660, partial [Coemansia sp. RSA 2618]